MATNYGVFYHLIPIMLLEDDMDDSYLQVVADSPQQAGDIVRDQIMALNVATDLTREDIVIDDAFECLGVVMEEA